MKNLHKLLLLCVPFAALTACGGSDTEDRLDVADPVVRFVHAAPNAPAVTLYRRTVAQSDATNVNYGFTSNYFDVDTSAADWSVKTAVGGVDVGTFSIDAQRGNKYTVVALATSATTAGTYVIDDPYNKPLGSDSTRLRLMNASYNAANVDVYMNALGTDIAPLTPLIAATPFNRSGPVSGSDSVDIPGGTYQLTITAAGTKTVLFKGQLTFGANRDVLILTVPDATQTSGVNALVSVEGTTGAAPITPI
ncbi:MAG TPA: DUF4397 domain-containing protein [Burkholderiaceae bacterium]